MDDGEVEISDQVVLRDPNSSSNFHGSVSADSYLDEFLKHTRTCTHTHTCNPPGPDAAQHTHTCYHTHTQVFASEDDDNHPNNKRHSSSKAKRPPGNREAVRKYREKKKAHTAYLEEEVRKLHLLNQQIVRKLQGRAILEAEVLRLRSLLLELKGKIDNELGVSLYQKQCNTTSVLMEGGCRVQHPGGEIGLGCHTDLQCFHPHAEPSSRIVSWEGNCQPMITDFRAEGPASDPVETLMSSASQAE